MTRSHRFDLYTQYEHMPEHLQGFSRPFCVVARAAWNHRSRPDAADLVVRAIDGLLEAIDWSSSSDAAEADAARELLTWASAQASIMPTGYSATLAPDICRAIIQAKDAWVRANLPEPDGGAS